MPYFLINPCTFDNQYYHYTVADLIRRWSSSRIKRRRNLMKIRMYENVPISFRSKMSPKVSHVQRERFCMKLAPWGFSAHQQGDPSVPCSVSNCCWEAGHAGGGRWVWPGRYALLPGTAPLTRFLATMDWTAVLDHILLPCGFCLGGNSWGLDTLIPRAKLHLSSFESHVSSILSQVWKVMKT